MVVLFRFLLFAFLIYLIVRMIRGFMSGPRQEDTNMKAGGKERRVSRDVGEYVDFEEVNEAKEQREKGEEGHTGKGTSRVSDKSNKTRDFR